jgi:hypothetical protein
MAGNHNNFRGNQFSSYIIPLVDRFTAPGTRFNPFEAWAAANVLTAFTQRWQGSQSNNQASYALNGSYVDRTTDGDTKLVDSFASKIEYAANRERTFARTNLVQQLEKKLKSAFVGGSNAWVDWLHAIEYYFDNVDFVSYFTYNYNGEYRQLVFDSLAMFKHPELTLDGYDFIIKTEEVFLIDFRNAKATEIAGKYSVINDQVTGDNHILWWNTGSIPQPTVSVPNPVYTELVIGLDADPAAISQVLELAINGDDAALSFMNVISSGEILELEFVADEVFQTDTLMPGTAATGIDFNFSDKLYASDNTELASGITTLAEYATLYNSLLVPYELNTFGISYPYIIGFGGGSVTESDGTTACGDCQQIQGWKPREDDEIIQGCKKCYNFAGGGGPKGAGATAFRSGSYEGSSYTSPIKYNTPGTIFNVVEGAKSQITVKDVDANL